MLALVIDTSSAAVTTGVVEVSRDVGAGTQVLAERVIIDARAHGELLAPLIRTVLDQAAVALGDLSAVIAGVGPGPFTGLRIGLVTAAAICDAVGLPAYPVCSLDAIAIGAGQDGPLLVAGDARRREVYWARYLDSRREQYPAVTRPTDISVSVVAMAGAGARLYEEVFGLPLLDCDYPPVAGLAVAAADRIRSGADTQTLTPMYLRRPDAVPATQLKPVSP